MTHPAISRDFFPLFAWLRFAVLVGTAVIAPALHAMGSPPLITDDPGTPGDRHWEINLGVLTERRPGEQRTETPLVDLNYGLGAAVQLKYEVPFVRLSENGSSRSGLGNSEAGVKWRFLEPEQNGCALSVYPQVEFNYPHSSSPARGLAESGTAFLLPFQLEKATGGVTWNAQLGREFQRGDDAWFYGVAASHELNEKIELGLEFVGSATARLARSQLATNFGVIINTSAKTSISFSVGRELHNHFAARATLLGYAGVQLRL